MPKYLVLLLMLERATRFERATLTLARLCSTPELRPRSKQCWPYCAAGSKIQYAFRRSDPRRRARS
jgi:hypothetical protein